MQDHIYVKGARENNLKNVDVTIPRDKLVVLTGLSGSGKSSLALAGGAHRPVGQRQVLPGLRHHLRGGPAAVRGVPVLLRPDVPGADGEARRGLHRRPVPRHLHRPEDHLEKPPVHRGDGDRDLRLPAPAVGPGGHPSLPHLRQGDQAADHRPDHRPGAGAARGHPYPGDGPCHPGQEGRARQGL